MKSNTEILDSKRITQVKYDDMGSGMGLLTIPSWQGSVIWSVAFGWEHVSVHPFKKRLVPSWDDMCMIKGIFWHDDEWVVQYHPAEDEYVHSVGDMQNIMHLWRPTGEALPKPPWWLVGLPKGKKIDDMPSMIQKRGVGYGKQ